MNGVVGSPLMPSVLQFLIQDYGQVKNFKLRRRSFSFVVVIVAARSSFVRAVALRFGLYYTHNLSVCVCLCECVCDKHSYPCQCMPYGPG